MMNWSDTAHVSNQFTLFEILDRFVGNVRNGQCLDLLQNGLNFIGYLGHFLDDLWTIRVLLVHLDPPVGHRLAESDFGVL